MKSKAKKLRMMAGLALILIAGIASFTVIANTANADETDYASLKNGAEMQQHELALNTTSSDYTNLVKCDGGSDDEKKCDAGSDDEKKCDSGKDDEKKCGDGDKKDDESKCGEGKCGDGSN